MGMKLDIKNSPRRFRVGVSGKIEITDCGSIFLLANEQVTFVTSTGKRYDVTAKEWGFYATPSLNGRLRSEGFKSALVSNEQGKCYLMLVEVEKVAEFETYLAREKNRLERWLDEP